MKPLIALLFLFLLAACSALPAPKTLPLHRYLLESKPSPRPPPTRRTEVLSISLPAAAPGYDTPQMAYLRQPLELEYFASHRWADTPAQMIQAVMLQTLAAEFSAVVSAPGQLPANLRLDTELIKLQQDFTRQPSRIQLTLRAQLINVKEKRVIAERRFDETENADSENAYGGALAANRALQRILMGLSEFCQTAENKK